jgi:hypothetical protein
MAKMTNSHFYFIFLIPNFVFSFPVWLKLKISSKKQGIKEGNQRGALVQQGTFLEEKTRCIIHNGPDINLISTIDIV